jgi:hypothetical protein
MDYARSRAGRHRIGRGFNSHRLHHNRLRCNILRFQGMVGAKPTATSADKLPRSSCCHLAAVRLSFTNQAAKHEEQLLVVNDGRTRKC